VTTFVLGLLILAGILALVANYSEQKPWMGITGLFVGVAYGAVFFLGGNKR